MVARPSTPAPPIRLRAPERPPHNLPSQPTPLIGRDDAIDALCTQLRTPDVRLLTLTGPPGTGKTRLAHAVAVELLSDFEHEVWFISLETVRDPDGVLAAVAHTLGVREAPGQPLDAALAASVAGRQLMLVLDNFEQVLDASVKVAALLAACPRLTVLATSRAPLRLRWEHEAPVPPLAVPEPGRPSDAETIAASPAARLFVERAAAVLPGFRLTAENAGAVAEICRRLDGLPLAIELAAARIKLLPPAALCDRLDARLHLLASGARDLPARHQTLRASLAWSYDLLSCDEQELFRGLGVFAGGCTLTAATAIAGLTGHGGGLAEVQAVDEVQSPHREPLVLAILSSLLDHSLVRQEPGPGGEPRYRLLETLREYAQEQLAAAGELPDVQRRHAAFFVALAEAAGPKLAGADHAAWRARLEADHDNIRSALSWALAAGEVEIGVRIARPLVRFWGRFGYAAEGRRWLDRLLSTDADVPPRWRARAKQAAGMLALAQGDLPAARVALSEGLALGEQLGELRDIATTLNGLGNIASQQGDFSEARRRYEQSLALSRELDDGPQISVTLNNLGGVIGEQGDFAAAGALFEEGLTLARGRGDAVLVAIMLQNLGELAQRQGDDATAQSFYEAALSQQRTVGDRRTMGTVLCNLGELALHRGDIATARARLGEGLALQRSQGDKRGLGLTLNALAALARHERDLIAARAYLAESLTLRQEIGDKAGIADCLGQGAYIAGAQGDHLTGVRLLAAAEALREALDAPLAPSARAEHDRAVEAMRAAHGEVAFAALWAEGRAISPEDAIARALALATAGEPSTPVQALPEDDLRAPRPALPNGLTPREVEVLRLIAAGHSNPEIAAALVLSVHTVERHTVNIYAKIGARGRADAIAFAHRHRLTEA